MAVSASLGESGLSETLSASFTVSNDWAVVGAGLAGVNGVPALSAQGELMASQAGALSLTSAAAGAPAYLVLGFSALNGAFKGGVLVPSSDLLLPPLSTDASGALSLPFVWPHGVLSGTQIRAQCWVADVTGPAGFAASNGLLGTAQ